MEQATEHLASPLSVGIDLTDAEQLAAFTGSLFNHEHGVSISTRRDRMSRWLPRVMVELGPDGATRWNDDRSKPGLHVIRPGTPHRIPHVFGYWHVSDVDEIYLWIPDPEIDQVTTILVERERSSTDQDLTAWYCRTCWRQLFAHVAFNGGTSEWTESAMRETDIAIRAFNDDASLRTCRHCGDVHSFAYGLRGLSQVPDDGTARRAW